jgi:hypothetical protein
MADILRIRQVASEPPSVGMTALPFRPDSSTRRSALGADRHVAERHRGQWGCFAFTQSPRRRDQVASSGTGPVQELYFRLRQNGVIVGGRVGEAMGGFLRCTGACRLKLN